MGHRFAALIATLGLLAVCGVLLWIGGPHGPAATTPVTIGEPLDIPAIRKGAPVPRRFYSKMPPGFDALEVHEGLKGRFISIILPLILAENEALAERRAFFETLLARTRRTASEQALIDRACDEFDIDCEEPRTLLTHIDIVPVSLALAQSIEESGWGRSRSAMQGRALFGQWTFKLNQGIETKRRSNGLVFAVRKFDTLQASVRAYMFNLNHHRAYRAFRAARAKLRAADQDVTGLALVGSLTRYSERGPAYVAGLRGIIRLNRLHQFEDAALVSR